MSIIDLSALVALLLSISLAAERLVAVVKSLIPWLAVEPIKNPAVADTSPDRWRQLLLQILMFLAGWVTSAFLCGPRFDLFGSVTLSSSGSLSLPAIVMGLLSSGGSAFWTSLLGYTKAVQEGRTTRSLKERMEFQRQYEETAASPGR